MISNERAEEIAENIVYEEYERVKWLVQAIAKRVKHGLVPDIGYLANSSTVRTMCRRKRGVPHGYDGQKVRIAVSKKIFEQLIEDGVIKSYTMTEVKV